MAKSLQLHNAFKQRSALLLLGIPSIAFVAFSGLSVYWVTEPYDGWRIFQILLLMMLGLYAAFMRIQSTTLSVEMNRFITASLLLVLILVIGSVWRSTHPARAIADASLYGLLAIGVWVQADLLRKYPSLASHIAACLAIFPILTAVYLLQAIFDATTGQLIIEWHRLFSNIRMFDDALLPCLFLLWQRPAWLAERPTYHVILSRILTTIIYAVSTIYLLVFWYDGARAALCSIVIGLIFIAILRQNQSINLRLPILTLLGSGLFFLILQHITSYTNVHKLLRAGSSGRDGLWDKALQLWQSHPIFGVGGDNFVVTNPWLLNGHPHNIPLQLISEWGVAGLLAMLLLAPILIQIYRHRQILPAFVVASIIAVTIDAFMSGILVYPLSQMLGLWPLAWLISLLPTHTFQPISITSLNHKKHNVSSLQKLLTGQWINWQFVLKIISVIAILAMLAVHGQDIICSQCTSIDPYNAPRFWQYGRSLHLESFDRSIQDIAINNQ
ncbi:MAG: O-antigen ligase family protein [Gammaproteobacteria bacterium]|nr:O-antigen ligase family protein [Gammaproteobacteria bacterium]